VEDVDDTNKLIRPIEKCTKDGKHQTVNKLYANPGSTIRLNRHVNNHYLDSETHSKFDNIHSSQT